MRKSIALFLTLSFLIILIALLSSILAIYKKYSYTEEAIYNQTSVLIKDVTSILSNIEINSSEDVEDILTSIPFTTNEGDYRGIIEIKPIFNKINLNEYLVKNKANPTIDLFLTNLLEKYEIADPIFFKDLILDSLDLDKEERSGYSEIALEDSNFKNAPLTFKRFEKILKYYAKKRDDNNIFKIPWKNLIFFTNVNTPLVCDFVDKNLTILFGIDKSLCEAIKDKDLHKKLEYLDIIPFNKKRSFWINIDINFSFQNSKNSLKIIYDLTKKKVISIESYPIY